MAAVRRRRRRAPLLLLAAAATAGGAGGGAGGGAWCAPRGGAAARLPGPRLEQRQLQVSLAAVGTVQEQQEEEDGWAWPRRLALGLGGTAVVSAFAAKKFLAEGNMSELQLAAGSLTGRVILITGGNSGLGRESAVRLARAGATVVITARTEQKCGEALEDIRSSSGSADVHCLQLDLADLASVKSFPKAFEAQPYGNHIDVLMNNAGVLGIPTWQLTKDGFEEQFATNHLGHFALVGKLLPLLEKAPRGARIINVSSSAHLGATKLDLDGRLLNRDDYNGFGVYCQTKLANILFTRELDARLKAAGWQHITAVSCHPGTISRGTNLKRWVDPEVGPALRVLINFFDRPVTLGANTQLYLAAGLDSDGGYDASGGLYFDNMRPEDPSAIAQDDQLAKRLWSLSEQLTGMKIEP